MKLDVNIKNKLNELERALNCIQSGTDLGTPGQKSQDLINFCNRLIDEIERKHNKLDTANIIMANELLLRFNQDNPYYDYLKSIYKFNWAKKPDKRTYLEKDNLEFNVECLNILKLAKNNLNECEKKYNNLYNELLNSNKFTQAFALKTKLIKAYTAISKYDSQFLDYREVLIVNHLKDLKKISNKVKIENNGYNIFSLTIDLKESLNLVISHVVFSEEEKKIKQEIDSNCKEIFKNINSRIFLKHENNKDLKETYNIFNNENNIDLIKSYKGKNQIINKLKKFLSSEYNLGEISSCFESENTNYEILKLLFINQLEQNKINLTTRLCTSDDSTMNEIALTIKNKLKGIINGEETETNHDYYIDCLNYISPKISKNIKSLENDDARYLLSRLLKTYEAECYHNKVSPKIEILTKYQDKILKTPILNHYNMISSKFNDIIALNNILNKIKNKEDYQKDIEEFFTKFSIRLKKENLSETEIRIICEKKINDIYEKTKESSLMYCSILRDKYIYNYDEYKKDLDGNTETLEFFSSSLISELEVQENKTIRDMYASYMMVVASAYIDMGNITKASKIITEINSLTGISLYSLNIENDTHFYLVSATLDILFKDDIEYSNHYISLLHEQFKKEPDISKQKQIFIKQFNVNYSLLRQEPNIAHIVDFSRVLTSNKNLINIMDNNFKYLVKESLYNLFHLLCDYPKDKIEFHIHDFIFDQIQGCKKFIDELNIDLIEPKYPELTVNNTYSKDYNISYKFMDLDNNYDYSNKLKAAKDKYLKHLDKFCTSMGDKKAIDKKVTKLGFEEIIKTNDEREDKEYILPKIDLTSKTTDNIKLLKSKIKSSNITQDQAYYYQLLAIEYAKRANHKLDKFFPSNIRTELANSTSLMKFARLSKDDENSKSLDNKIKRLNDNLRMSLLFKNHKNHAGLEYILGSPQDISNSAIDYILKAQEAATNSSKLSDNDNFLEFDNKSAKKELDNIFKTIIDLSDKIKVWRIEKNLRLSGIKNFDPKENENLLSKEDNLRIFKRLDDIKKEKAIKNLDQKDKGRSP